MFVFGFFHAVSPVLEKGRESYNWEKNVAVKIDLSSSPHKIDWVNRNLKRQEENESIKTENSEKKQTNSLMQTVSEFFGQESPHFADAEFVFSQKLFSTDSSEDTWIKWIMYGLGTHYGCVDSELDLRLVSTSISHFFSHLCLFDPNNIITNFSQTIKNLDSECEHLYYLMNF